MVVTPNAAPTKTATSLDRRIVVPEARLTAEEHARRRSLDDEAARVIARSCRELSALVLARSLTDEQLDTLVAHVVRGDRLWRRLVDRLTVGCAVGAGAGQ